jgi:hypothetical protein
MKKLTGTGQELDRSSRERERKVRTAEKLGPAERGIQGENAREGKWKREKVDEEGESF